MGLGDIVSTVLTRYKADTKQHRDELKKLQGEEKKRHKELLEDMEKQNAKIDSQIAMWGKIAVGVGAAVGAVKLLDSSMDVYAERNKLRMATAGADIDRLQKAIGGLATETEVLRFAQQAMNGTFELSQAQMETVLRGARALAAQGHDLREVLERMGQAVREGNVEPLKEYGIVLDTTTNDTMAGAIKVVEALDAEYRKMGGSVEAAGDETARAKVKFSDALGDLQEQLGKFAEALTPVIELLAEAVGGIAILVKELGDLPDTFAGALGGGRSVLLQAQSRVQDARTAELLARADRAMRLGQQYDASAIKSEFREFTPEQIAADRRNNPFASERKKRSGGGGEIVFAAEVDPATQEQVNRIMAQRMAEEQARQDFRISHSQPVFGSSANTKIQLEQTAQAQRELFQAQQEHVQMLRQAGINEQNSLMSQIFGTPAEIGELTAAIQMAGGAFDVFAQSAGAGIDALITGSESFGTAVKKALAEGLRALAVDMGVQALKHGAFAAGSLAFGNAPGAVAHGQAAGLFAAGAIAAGVAANQLGAGQGGRPTVRAPSTAGLGGAGARLSSGAGGEGNRTTFVVLDDGFDSMPAAARRNHLRRRARQAGYEFDGDVVQRR